VGLFDDWFEAGPVGFVGFDVGFFAEGEPNVVEAFHEPPAGVVVHIKPVGVVFAGDGAVFQVDCEAEAGLVGELLPQLFDVLLVHEGCEQAGFAGVATEDVGESGGEDDFESVVHECPDGVFAGGAGAEVGAGDEDGAVGVGVLVEDEVGFVGAPVVEESVVEAGAGDTFEVDGGDDLVGVDVGAHEWNADAGVGGEFFHDGSLCGLAGGVGGQVGGGCEGAHDGGGGGDFGGYEVGAAAGPLAAFEVSVAGGGGALPGFELVGVHAEAHGAAGGAPVGAGFGEDFVESFGFGELFDQGGGGHDHHADRVGDFVAFHDVGCGAEVFDAGVGAGAEEDRVDFDVPQGGAGGKAHVGEGFFGGFFVVFVGEVVG